MMDMMTQEDKHILRDLARRVDDIARSEEQQEKRELWKRHTALMGDRPPIFVSPEGSWREILPDGALKCSDEFARGVEAELRRRIFRFESIQDDTPIERVYEFPVSAIPINEGWGMTPERLSTGDERGAWRHQPVVTKPSDWKKLKKPELRVDERGAQRRQALLQDAVGDLLEVKVTGVKVFDFHLAHIYCDFRGLEGMLYDLALEEEMVKEVFEFFTEGFEGLIHQIEAANLIELNNDYTYHYTGGLGYTQALPKDGFDPANVRTQDVWAAAEAQEFSCVSPEMHAELILPYERRLLTPFGLNGYGCCDDLTEKLDGVLEIPNLRRVAACPWADLGKMAARLKKQYILTWKPQPAYLAEEHFDPDFVEQYLFDSLSAAKVGYPEIILRDTHTCRAQPERFGAFVRAARRAIERVYDA